MIAERVVRGWYQGAPWLHLLRPLAWLFERVVRRRRARYLAEKDRLWRPEVPVIVVGNITVGGTGKSPLVAALVSALRAQGWKPGVISRGYGGQALNYPMLVTKDSPVSEAGDEPVMLAQLAQCPIVVDPERVRAVQHLLASSDVDLVISDDGLQHYRLWRDLEIAVLDGTRGLGNGLCLPAGPLREPAERLNDVDIRVCNGLNRTLAEIPCWEMTLKPTALVRIQDGKLEDLADWKGRQVHAVAGIGNPERFFETLRGLGLSPQPHAFHDHHRYNSADLEFNDPLPIVMTDKDAVKCREFATENMYALRVEAVLDAGFYDQVQEKINQIQKVSDHHG